MIIIPSQLQNKNLAKLIQILDKSLERELSLLRAVSGYNI